MGILINATENKPITLSGTEVTVPSVYARLSFKAYPDGQTLEIFTDIYLSKAVYSEGATVFCDVPNGCFFSVIDVLTETQSLDYAHTYAIQHYENLGYQCQVI